MPLFNLRLKWLRFNTLGVKKKDRSIRDDTQHFSRTESQIGAVFMINGQGVGINCQQALKTLSANRNELNRFSVTDV
jgi:hypothetical protein